jgi:hypothetical protein
MKNPNVTNSNPFPYEVKVNLHMFRALMLNRVGREVNCTDIVAINQSRLGKRIVELLKKLSKPGGLSNSIGDSPILSLCTRASCHPRKQHIQKLTCECPDTQPNQRPCRPQAQRGKTDVKEGHSASCPEDTAIFA